MDVSLTDLEKNVAADGFLLVQVFICAPEWIGISRIPHNDFV